MPFQFGPGVHQALVEWLLELSPGGKAARPWRWPPTLSSVEIKNGHSYASTPLSVFIACCRVIVTVHIVNKFIFYWSQQNLQNTWGEKTSTCATETFVSQLVFLPGDRGFFPEGKARRAPKLGTAGLQPLLNRNLKKTRDLDVMISNVSREVHNLQSKSANETSWWLVKWNSEN